MLWDVPYISSPLATIKLFLLMQDELVHCLILVLKKASVTISFQSSLDSEFIAEMRNTANKKSISHRYEYLLILREMGHVGR